MSRTREVPADMPAKMQWMLGHVERLVTVDVPPQQSRSTAAPGTPDRRRWQRRYARAAAGTDVLAVALSSASYALWGNAPDLLVVQIGLVVVALSAACLRLARAWEPSMLGQGSVEFTRLLRGFLAAAVIVALFSLAGQRPEARPWVFGVLPIAGGMAATGRIGLRRWLHGHRRAGRAVAHVLAVGTAESVGALVERTSRAPQHGWLVTGVCTPTGTAADGTDMIQGVPVVGDLDAVARLAVRGDYDAVSVGQA